MKKGTIKIMQQTMSHMPIDILPKLKPFESRITILYVIFESNTYLSEKFKHDLE